MISLFKRVVYITPQITSTSAKGMIRNKYSNPAWFKKRRICSCLGNDTEEYLPEQMTVIDKYSYHCEIVLKEIILNCKNDNQ